MSSGENLRILFNLDKFKQILHYIISKTESSPNVGKKVLYKLLYFNDYNYYELQEVKMTGEVYANYKHGPAPRHFEEAADMLKKEGAIEERSRKYYGRDQIKFYSLKEPDLSLLSAKEINHIDDTLRRYGSMNGSQIEAVSHKDIPWMASTTNQDMDYELVFYRSAEMSVREYCDRDDD